MIALLPVKATSWWPCLSGDTTIDNFGEPVQGQFCIVTIFIRTKNQNISCLLNRQGL